MKIVLFCHSLRSDWNNGNAHFLRGVVSELGARGHVVRVFEPRDGWSIQNLRSEAGAQALEEYRTVYPELRVQAYDPETLDLGQALDGAELVLVHEWNDVDLVRRLGRHRAQAGRYRLLFHDTHHRMVSAPEQMGAYDFSGYDAVLAFGEVLRERYVALGWADRAFTWHEAADTRVFYPRRSVQPAGDLVWIGNFGDEERSRELSEFLLEPAAQLSLSGRVHGVRYPEQARAALERAHLEYRGWLPNYRAPETFAAFRVTVHVPRRPYAEALPGIPTIRPFEALACGIPLVSAPWQDTEGLFEAGRDFLLARDGAEMTRMLYDVTNDPALAQALATQGLATIRARHTCAHRVDELLEICRSLGLGDLVPVRAGSDAGRATEREDVCAGRLAPTELTGDSL
jgi:spore maturation protein CgeB